MGVYKEQISVLEELAGLTERIYPEAEDYGIMASLNIKNKIRYILQTLPNLNVEKNNNKLFIYRHYSSRIMWGKEDGVMVDIEFTKDLARRKEYFNIKLHNISIERMSAAG